MAWVKTNEDDDRYVLTDNCNWVQVQPVDTHWEIALNSASAGTFYIGNYASQVLAETALTTMVATW